MPDPSPEMIESKRRHEARELLKRPPLRRGPYLFDEEWLREIAYPPNPK